MATYQALDPATRDSVIAQAKQRAAASGKTPEQELYDYAQSQGIDTSGIDTLMGFAPGASQSWAQQNIPNYQSNSGVSNLGMGATPAATPTATPAAASGSYLGDAGRDSIVAQAKARAAASGKTPEQELWDYAKSQGIDAAGIDQRMGYNPGASQKWAQQNIPNYQSNSGSSNLGMGGGGGGAATTGGPSGDTNAASVKLMYEQMRRMTDAGNEQGARDLYNANQKAWGFTDQQFSPYATHDGGTFNADQIGTWKGTGQTQTGTQTHSTEYNPMSNPYLGQMGKDIGNQMFDQWARNTLPGIRSGAMVAGGFGGSRQGVVEANGINDMQRNYGQALTSMYGNDWSNQQNRNIQTQANNNNYDLGLRNNDLGFSILDANIYQNNFNNQLAGANLGMNTWNAQQGANQGGINAGTTIQNTPYNNWSNFNTAANSVGNGLASTTGTQNMPGNPAMGALGGWQLGSSLYGANNKSQANTGNLGLGNSDNWGY